MSKIRLPGYTAETSLGKGGEATHRNLMSQNSKNIAIVPQQRAFCSECEWPCDACRQCYIDYVYTGLEHPSYCYKSSECNSCQECEQDCIPEII